MNRTLLEQYATLKIKQKQIEAELDMMQPQVLTEIRAISVDQPVMLENVGTYSITKKKKWQFSEAVMDLKVKVTDMETQEKADGTAKFEEQEVLVFRELTTKGITS